MQNGHEPSSPGPLPAGPPALQAAILQEAQTTIPALARARSAAIQDIHKLRLASKSEEARLRETLDSQVASVTQTKQSLILQQLLDRHHYPDRRIGQELREGFPLTQPSGLWPTAILPPTITVNQLLTNAQAITDHSLSKVLAAPIDDIKANGWIRLQSVQPAPHPHPVVSTRFGVVQKNKIRPIDNFRASHVNAACGTSEKVLVDGPDLIAQACLQLLAQTAPSQGKDRLVGRTWDLKSAYKQLAVRADHSRFAWIAVQDPTTKSLHLAQMHSMPFGAVASVHAFLRCSEALKFLGRSHLLLVITSYFDDFTVLTWQTTAHHTTLVVETFFQQMGWTVSPEAKKNSPFSPLTSAAKKRASSP